MFRSGSSDAGLSPLVLCRFVRAGPPSLRAGSSERGCRRRMYVPVYAEEAADAGAVGRRRARHNAHAWWHAANGWNPRAAVAALGLQVATWGPWQPPLQVLGRLSSVSVQVHVFVRIRVAGALRELYDRYFRSVAPDSSDSE